MSRPAHEVAADILNCYDDETGEIDPDALEALQDEMADKIAAIGYLVAERRGWAHTALEESARQKARADVFIKDAQRLSDRAHALLGVLNVKRLVTPTATASVHKGALRTVIDDEDAVPIRFKTYETKVKIDKKAIGADIDKGADVPGASRVRGDDKLHWK